MKIFKIKSESKSGMEALDYMVCTGLSQAAVYYDEIEHIITSVDLISGECTLLDANNTNNSKLIGFSNIAQSIVNRFEGLTKKHSDLKKRDFYRYISDCIDSFDDAIEVDAEYIILNFKLKTS